MMAEGKREEVDQSWPGGSGYVVDKWLKTRKKKGPEHEQSNK